jgi:hypothetical protein
VDGASGEARKIAFSHREIISPQRHRGTEFGKPFHHGEHGEHGEEIEIRRNRNKNGNKKIEK